MSISTDGGSTWNFLGNASNAFDWKYFAYNITSYGWSSNARFRFSFDTMDSVENNMKGWIIDDIFIGVPQHYEHFELWIEQENFAGLYEERGMNFNITSYFNHSMNVNITILIETPIGVNETLYEIFLTPISANGSWSYSLNYNFTYSGYYDVWFILIDDIGKKWEIWCWWDITGTSGEYFELWIDQDNNASLYDEGWMDFSVYSYFSHSMNVSIEIIIQSPTNVNQSIFYNGSVNMTAYGSWYYSKSVNFTEVGVYDVFFLLIDDIGVKWSAWCWWNITSTGGEYFELWIEQAINATLYEDRTMNFNLTSYFSHSMDVNITILIETPSDVNETLHEVYFMPIEAYGPWSLSLTHNFTEVGVYEVFFLLIDDIGVEWSAWCWWDITGTSGEYFELWIDQDNYAGLDEERWMDFDVYSHFSHSMNVSVEIIIGTPSNVNQTIYYNSSVNMTVYGSWYFSLSYKFNESGHYNIWLILIDDIGVEWSAWCWWEIKDKPPFNIWIDQEKWAIVGQPVEMRVHVQNFEPISRNLQVSLFMIEYNAFGDVINNHSFDYKDFFLPMDGYFEFPISYTFNHKGYYEVQALITDDFGYSLDIMCWFDVYNQGEGFIILDLRQPFETWVDLPAMHSIYVQNAYNYGQYVDLNLTILEYDSSGYLLDEFSIFNMTIWLDPNAGFNEEITHYFDHAGDYEVRYSAIGQDLVEYTVNCSWHIIEPETNTLTYYVDQWFNALAGDQVWHHLTINSQYNVGQNVIVTVVASQDITTLGGGEFTIFHDQFWIDTNGSISFDFPWIFNDPGWYNLRFTMQAMSDSVIYETKSHWNIHPQMQQGIDVWFEDPNPPSVEPGFTANNVLNIRNNFGHGMYVDLKVYLYKMDSTGSPSPGTIIHSETIWIEGGFQIKTNFTHTFNSQGAFDVQALVLDDNNAPWEAWSKWNVFGSGIQVSAPDSVDVNETFEIKVEVFADVISPLFVDSITIKLSNNGTVIRLQNVSRYITGMSEIFIFSVQFDSEGKYDFRVTVNTDGEPFEKMISVHVGVEPLTSSSETSESSDKDPGGSTPSLSPGFESVIILFVMAISAIVLRKRNK